MKNIKIPRLAITGIPPTEKQMIKKIIYEDKQELDILIDRYLEQKENWQKLREMIFAVMHYTNELDACEVLKYMNELEEEVMNR